MSVEIPWSRIAGASAPRPVLFSGNQEGSLGGIDLPVPRLGDRFAIDLRTAQLRQDAEARLLIAALTQATTADARVAFHQPLLPSRSQAGPNVVVDGAGQSGSNLALRGIQAGAALLIGQFFTIVHGGVGYVHMATGQVIADSSGRFTVPIWPMLRFLTADGEPAAVDRPYIEGRLVGFDTKGASFTRNRVEPLEFSIVERA